ncbi:MAG: secretin N-terminal domain-containing protein [Deltaproteobacteria bacterium]
MSKWIVYHMVVLLVSVSFSSNVYAKANSNKSKQEAQYENKTSRDSDLDALEELESVISEEKRKEPSSTTGRQPVSKAKQPQRQIAEDDSLDNTLQGEGEGEFSAGPDLDANASEFPELDLESPTEPSKSKSTAISKAKSDDLTQKEELVEKSSVPYEGQSSTPKTVTSKQPQLPAVVSSVSESVPAANNEIFNLEFKMEGDVSRIYVTSRYKLRYQEKRNAAMKQYVYVFENTMVPERIERAYDTSEFLSPVALFTLLQTPKNKVPLAKLIIQLREDKTPVVTNTEKGMFIDFPAPDEQGDARVALGDENKKFTSEENTFSPNQVFTGRPIERLEIKNTDIQDVIRLIGRSSGYNIVIGEDVTGKIGALSLENIPWDQAFALVLQSKKLGYVRQGNVLRVATLAALKSEKEEIAAVEQSKVKAESLRTVIIPISYAKATDLAPKGKSLMSERGSMEVDERSNSIIVRDIDRSVGKMQKLYAMLDTQPPIVSVSAKVVEMKSDFSRSFGMNILKFGTSTSGINADVNFDKFSVSGNTINIKAPDFAKLDATIGLAELEGQTKVLANPTVSVNQNQKATMTQTLSSFFPVAQQGAGGFAVPSLQAIDTTLSLEVTPIVSGDGSISMTVNVKNEVPQKASGGASVSVDKRNVQTQVLLENGDTAVIGGAFSSTSTTSLGGIPGLMRLPLVGMLFSSTELKEIKNEILIFLTAKILNTEESFKRTF